MTYSFHTFNAMAHFGSSVALKRLLGEQEQPPVIVCVGSDLVIGDSLGPLVGTMLSEQAHIAGYVYGTLRSPVTAKEIRYLQSFLKKTHPRSKVIAIDASFGQQNEIGLIKLTDAPLRPGSGVNKSLQEIGDVCILGIVAQKSAFPVQTLDLIRLSAVYRMAELIAKTVSTIFANETQGKSIC